MAVRKPAKACSFGNIPYEELASLLVETMHRLEQTGTVYGRYWRIALI